MYGFNPDNLPKKTSPFPVRESVSDVQLRECTFVEGDGWQAIDFTWIIQSTEGEQVLNDRRFAVNEENIFPRDDESIEDAIARAYANFNGILNHIGRKFVSEGALQGLTGDSFKEIADQYCPLINESCKGVMLYLKTIPNKKGYTQVAKYPRFCQLMSEGDSKLAYTPQETKIIENVDNNNSGINETTTHKPSSYV